MFGTLFLIGLGWAVGKYEQNIKEFIGGCMREIDNDKEE